MRRLLVRPANWKSPIDCVNRGSSTGGSQAEARVSVPPRLGGLGLAAIQSGYFEEAAAGTGARPAPATKAVRATLPQPALFRNSRRFDPRWVGIWDLLRRRLMAPSTTRRGLCQGRRRGEPVDDRGMRAQTPLMARRIVAGLALISAVTLALAPMAAAGGRFHGGAAGGRGFVGRPFASHPFVHHPFVHHPFVARPFFPHHFFRPFVPFGVGVAVVVPPVYAYAGPPAYDAGSPYSDASSYYPPPVAYAPPAGGMVSVVPSPRPMQ